MFKDGLKNMAWGLSQQWIGGSQVMWLQEHVVLHHMHTGDVHMDPDAQMAPVRSRRPAVLRRLHAIDARRFQERRSWVVSFSILGPFGPRRATAMLRAGDAGLLRESIFAVDGAPALLFFVVGTRVLGRAEHRPLF